jgi:hypothetical protein
MNRETMNRAEAADFLRVSDGYISNLVASGLLTYIPGTYALRVDDVLELDRMYPRNDKGRRNIPWRVITVSKYVTCTPHVTGPDTYRVRIERGGKRYTESFKTLHAAEMWRDSFLARDVTQPQAVQPQPAAPQPEQRTGWVRRMLARMTQTKTEQTGVTA